MDKVVYYLSEALAAQGCEVIVLCESDKDVLPVPGVRVINTPRKRSCLKLSKHASEVLDEVSPDVIHLHSAYIPTGISVSKWARRKGVPYVISPHGNYSPQLAKRRRLIKAVYNFLFEFPCAANAKFVHSMGDERAIRDFGYRGAIRTVPNGFDMGTVLSVEKSGILEKRFPKVQGKRLILFVGRLDIEQKGIDLLIPGFAAAQADDAFLLIVGPDWQNGMKRAQEIASSCGLTDSKIGFWGSAFGGEKAELLQSADFFIHPSRWEGFPMSVIEAMAYRKPCIVSSQADPQGTLAELEILFPCDVSVEGIASAIEMALGASPQRIEEFGRVSRDLVSAEFSWAQVASQMVEAYRDGCGIKK